MNTPIDETKATLVKFCNEFSGCMLFTEKKIDDLLIASYTYFKEGPDINFRENPTKIFDIPNYNISHMVNTEKTSSSILARK